MHIGRKQEESKTEKEHSNFKFIEMYEQSEKDYGTDLPLFPPVLVTE